MAGTEVVAYFMRGYTPWKRLHGSPIRDAIRVGRAATIAPGPGDARSAAQIFPRPHVGYVAARAGKVRVPVIRKFSQHGGRIAARIVRIVRCVPGMLKAHREREANIPFVDSLNLIHDAQDV